MCGCPSHKGIDQVFKGTESQDFLLLFFFHESVSLPAPEYPISNFFKNFAEIFASQGAQLPPVSMSPAANCHRYQRQRLVLLIPVANLPPVSTIPKANLPLVSTTRWQFATSNNDTSGKFATGVNDTSGK
jgi:hypothetical protein